jgi:hypothetical protein
VTIVRDLKLITYLINIFKNIKQFPLFYIIILIISIVVVGLIIQSLNLLDSVSYFIFIFSLIIIGIYLIVMRYIISKNHNKKYDLLHVILAISIGLTFCIVITVQSEYVPQSYNVIYKEFNNMSVGIEIPSSFLIPLKDLFEPLPKEIKVLIYNTIQGLEIESVNIYSPSSSVITILKTELNRSTLTGSNEYNTKIMAKHDGEIFNRTDTFIIDISYWNNTQKTRLYHNLIPFEMNIHSFDLNITTYFWIVMLGVVVSRFIDFVLRDANKIEGVKKDIDDNGDTTGEKTRKLNTMKNELLVISEREALWIIFSFIISILVFNGFKETLSDLTTSILFNISLAFGFGFAFDRTLELATRFKSLSSGE